MAKNVETSAAEPHVLTSWKEVATYLGKGVRTVQRWEAELSLPVRRPYGVEKHVVIALPEELDQWMRTRMMPREKGKRDPVRGRTARESALSRVQQLERLHRLMQVMTERTDALNRKCLRLVEQTTKLTQNRQRGSTHLRGEAEGAGKR